MFADCVCGVNSVTANSIGVVLLVVVIQIVSEVVVTMHTTSF